MAPTFRLPRSFSLWSSVLPAGLVVLALVGAPAGAQTLRAVPHAQLETLDPIWTTAYITRSHGYLVYDTLFGLDEDLAPQPQMVERWTVSEDRLRWRFTLRPGQKWHDGADVTAEDAVASLIRWGARDGLGQALFSRVVSIQADDLDTFTIALSRPFPRMLGALSKMSSNVPFIMPRRVAETDPNKPITDPTGSGPYKFSLEEWEPGRKVVYLRNELYSPREEPASLSAGGKVAHLDRIEWISYDSQDMAIDALLANEVQYLESPSTSRVARLKDQPDVVTEVTDPTGNVGMAVFNHAIPPFDKVEVRRAIVQGMNQADYMRAALGDLVTAYGEPYWQVCASIYPCGTAHSTPVAASSFTTGDLDAARAMLATSGYDGNPVVVMDPVDSPVISAFTGVTLDLLRELSVKVDHRKVTWAELLERRISRTGEGNGAWNMFHTWWIAADMDDPLRIVFSGDPVRGWIGWPDDPELEALRAAYLDTEDADQLATLAAQAQNRIVDKAHLAVLGQFFEPIAYRTSVLGIQRPIQMYYNLALTADK